MLVAAGSKILMETNSWLAMWWAMHCIMQAVSHDGDAWLHMTHLTLMTAEAGEAAGK